MNVILPLWEFIFDVLSWFGAGLAVGYLIRMLRERRRP